MRRRAERQAEARQSWVEGLSFKPASIQQADRPPLSLGQRVKESIDKACALSLGHKFREHVCRNVQPRDCQKPLWGQSTACQSGSRSGILEETPGVLQDEMHVPHVSQTHALTGM